MMSMSFLQNPIKYFMVFTQKIQFCVTASLCIDYAKWCEPNNRAVAFSI